MFILLRQHLLRPLTVGFCPTSNSQKLQKLAPEAVFQRVLEVEFEVFMRTYVIDVLNGSYSPNLSPWFAFPPKSRCVWNGRIRLAGPKFGWSLGVSCEKR